MGMFFQTYAHIGMVKDGIKRNVFFDVVTEHLKQEYESQNLDMNIQKFLELIAEKSIQIHKNTLKERV